MRKLKKEKIKRIISLTPEDNELLEIIHRKQYLGCKDDITYSSIIAYALRNTYEEELRDGDASLIYKRCEELEDEG